MTNSSGLFGCNDPAVPPLAGSRRCAGSPGHHFDSECDQAEMPTLDRLFTQGEVAQLFRRSRRTIRSWVASGRLPQCKFGRATYYRRSDIERIISGAVDK